MNSDALTRRFRVRRLQTTWRMILFLSVTSGLLLIQPPLLQAEENGPADSPSPAETLGRELFEQMHASRTKLKSGVFHARRVIVLNDPKKKRDMPIKPYSEASIFCAFDFEKDLLRFDIETSVNHESTDSLCRYFTTRTEARLYTPDSGIVRDLPAQWHIDFKGTFRPFDIRLVGICNHAEFGLVSTYEEMVSFYEKESTASGKALGGDMSLLTLTHKAGKSEVRREITLDRSRNYVPLRFDLTYQKTGSQTWNSLHPAITATWQKRGASDVYVPVKLTFPDKDSVDEITFDWKAVNQPLDDKLFLEEDLKRDTTRP